MSPEPPSGEAFGQDAPAANAGLRRQPRLNVPREVLSYHRAALLDPDYAVTLPDDGPINPTVYVPTALKVSGLPGRSADRRFQAVQAAADKQGCEAEFESDDEELARYADGSVHARLIDRFWASRVLLKPKGVGPSKRPDAWKILQQVRADEPDLAQGIDLVHVLTACGPDIGGAPFVGGHATEGVPFVGGHGTGGMPFVGGHGSDGMPFVGGHDTGLPFVGGHGEVLNEYGAPGIGGRTPVVLGVADPRTGAPAGRRPVVCVPDTGVGQHPWFKHGVKAFTDFHGIEVGLGKHLGAHSEATGVGDGLTGLLDREAGHGTFIAGLIRQHCPSADILSVPVMGSDGSADELILQRALVLVLLRHLEALDGEHADRFVDVLSISLGYYHEKPEDLLSDQVFGPLFGEFGKHGVVVVCAAGNDATYAPLFPAAWADRDPLSRRDSAPMLAVGALNPDAETIALFSNGGGWVSCYRRGVALVSTVPVTFDASLQAGVRLQTADGIRATMDLDNFASGFATWSGTSFAAPVLAAEIADRLAKDDRITKVKVPDAVERARDALQHVMKKGRL